MEPGVDSGRGLCHCITVRARTCGRLIDGTGFLGGEPVPFESGGTLATTEREQNARTRG
jgi:hypothetical protein